MKELQNSEVVDQFLVGLMYPVSKEELLERARESKFDPSIMTALEALPERQYTEPADVSRELNPA
jgi:hypothetical protein